MTKLRAAAVGAGYFSRFHFEAWNRIADVDLVAICDRDEQKAQAACQQFGVPHWYTDAGKMIQSEPIDFLDVITRPDTHYELVQLAAEAGLPVICQKPLAPSFVEAHEIVELVKERNVPLMVHDNFRFQPWYRELRRLLDRGEVGTRLHSINIRTRTGDGWQADAYLARQPYFRTMERFLVFELGVHFIDTLRYLAGEVDQVYARLRRLNPEIAGEDAGIVLFDFASGASGIWDANRFNEANVLDPRLTFGEVLVEANQGSIRVAADGTMTVQRLGEPTSPHAYRWQPRQFAGDCVFATQQHFVDALVNGSAFETSGSDYLKTLAVQEAVYRSAATNQPVPINGAAT